MYTIRTVLPMREHDDARPSYITKHSDRLYSIFSGKIGTCVDIANELVKIINERILVDRISFSVEEGEIFGLLGSSGSGKTTTLYSALSILNSPETNIVTIEDPVEYIITGINQVQSKADIGLTFAAGLRSFLRQDPDVIMVGEIRDKETGEIAGNAALTGHVVFATLHTNDAPSTVIRLLNMGVEPVLIAATLRLIIAQRLLRRVCKECKTVDTVAQSDLIALGFDIDASKHIQLMKGRGCDICHGTGYKGRVGIYEVLEINEEMRQLIVRRAPPSEIRVAAGKTGVETLRQIAIKKLLAGLTTVEEVIRVTVADESGGA
jgi:type IV pilus assembly protein PilB